MRTSSLPWYSLTVFSVVTKLDFKVISDILGKFPAGYHWLVGGREKAWSGSGLTIPDTYFSSSAPAPPACADTLQVSAPPPPAGHKWDLNGLYSKDKVDSRYNDYYAFVIDTNQLYFRTVYKSDGTTTIEEQPEVSQARVRSQHSVGILNLSTGSLLILVGSAKKVVDRYSR